MKKIVFVAAALALFAMSSAAQAQNPLVPGATNVPVPVVINGETGTQLDTVTHAFNVKNPNSGLTLAGSVTESVFREANGTLNFDYQVTLKNNPPNNDFVDRITGANFHSTTTSVSQTATATGFGNGTVLSTSADRSPNGAVVGFNFATGVNAGQTSYVQIVSTSAKTYNKGSIGVIDSTTLNFQGFAPTPEPASLVLFGGLALGLGGARLRRWRQRKAVTA